MSNLEKLLDTFEREDYLLNIVNNMSARERYMASLSFGLIVDSISKDKISKERRDFLISELSLLSNMTDADWEEFGYGV